MTSKVQLALACSLGICAPDVIAAAQQPGEDFGTLLASGDFAGIQKLLDGPLLKTGLAGLERPDVKAGLVRQEFIRACGANELAAIFRREGGSAFLGAFFGDTEWIESFLISDPPKESFAQAAENLRLLHRHGKDLTDPLSRRLATAMALTAGKMNAYSLVERFGQIQRSHREGLLHGGFDQLTVREMRWAVYLEGNAADYEYLVHLRPSRARDYLGETWVETNRGVNDYGDPIEERSYYLPFRHGYSAAKSARSVGGMSGWLAANSTKARGIPAEELGERGQFGYIVRVGDSWTLGNSACPPAGATIPGWEGTGFATLTRLYEPVSNDLPRVLAADRAVWLARLQMDNLVPAADWSLTFEKAVAIQPPNYRTWQEWANALATSQVVTPEAKLKIALRAAETFAAHPEAAWGLIRRFADRSLGKLAEFERINFLAECHSVLREDKALGYADWPMEESFKWQAAQLGSPEMELEYFAKLLEIHGANPARKTVLTRLLAWGKDSYSSNPKTAPHFVHAMGKYFGRAGSDAVTVRKGITDGLLAAASAFDLLSFRLWSDMAANQLPPIQPEDVFLNARQSAKFPTVEPFPGELLSSNALLKTSSASQFDRPLSRAAILAAGGFGGFFDTAAEDAPHAIVQLQSESELSGIILVDRFELPQEAEWALPLNVSVSADGKSWSQVATFDSVQPAYRVDLKNAQARARFIRAERLPGKKERFHLRKILVFGKPQS